MNEVRFEGSSSQVAAIKRWMKTGEYFPPRITTRDLVPFNFIGTHGIETAKAGDVIMMMPDGSYTIKAEVTTMAAATLVSHDVNLIKVLLGHDTDGNEVYAFLSDCDEVSFAYCSSQGILHPMEEVPYRMFKRAHVYFTENFPDGFKESVEI